MGILVVVLSRVFLLGLHADLWLLQGLLDRRFGVLEGLVLTELVRLLAEMVWKLILTLSAVPIPSVFGRAGAVRRQIGESSRRGGVLEVMPAGELER